MAEKKKKPKKDSFTTRMKRRGREFRALGQTLAHEPRAFPGQMLQVIRRSIRTVWDARGGGFYACGYVITFVWLEIRMFVDDIVMAQSAGAYLGEQIFEIFFRYLGESLVNMIMAFIWPVFVLELSPQWGILALGVMYLVFAKLLKARIERWLFDDDAVHAGSAQENPDVREED